MQKETDPKAEELLYASYEAYYDEIFNFFLKHVQNADDAKDCAQETFLKYYERLFKSEKIKNPRAYLYQIAKHLYSQYCCEITKYNIYRETHFNVLELPDSLSLQDRLDLKQLEPYMPSIVQFVLNSLDDKEQHLYFDYYVHKLSAKQIAQRENKSVYLIHKRLKNLRQKIKCLVKKTVSDFQMIADYNSGMTDSYAINEYHALYP